MTDEETMKQLSSEFHEFWKLNGEPHPASNHYLDLNRAFYYTKGIANGIKFANKVHNETTRKPGVKL